MTRPPAPDEEAPKSEPNLDTGPRQRRFLTLRGAVQGVGFRPFAYRLARELHLGGYVVNDPTGVRIEIEGDPLSVEAFARRVAIEHPPRATPEIVDAGHLEPQGETEFSIKESSHQGRKRAVVLPDIATCPDCLADLSDPQNRRFNYPFTNCTNCGPRFSILLSVPYDRPHTTMARFVQCPDCQREYDDPLDRRFHAQPNACPLCGPALEWRHGDQEPRLRAEALQAAVAALRGGEIVALQGLGGFHLLAEAGQSEAVARLRQRKHREEKPLALMVPDLSWAHRLCQVSPAAEALLLSPEAPIVLLPRKTDAPVANEVAPGGTRLGIMLPYTPLHHLLMRELDCPVVATSGNLSDEPICLSPDEAQNRLGSIADGFLVHDRPIARQVDDSVFAMGPTGPEPLRRSRGHAPRPVRWCRPLPIVLAVGPHLKNTIALSLGDEVFVSQHVGDLGAPEARAAHERVVADFLEMYEATPVLIAHDLHPDYASSLWVQSLRDVTSLRDYPEWKRRLGQTQTVAVQHHHAHLVACLADNRMEGPALGVTWDGSGLGTDGTLWGGEFLKGDARGFERVAHFRCFRLPGGELAAKEPRRTALALLFEAFDVARYGEAAIPSHCPTLGAFGPSDRALLLKLLARGFQSPITSSAGRLFDGIASLIGLRQQASFEGQAGMELEQLAAEGAAAPYPLPLEKMGEAWELDWRPLVRAVVQDHAQGLPSPLIAQRFHETLVQGIREVARRVGLPAVALTGGCFQNQRLMERTWQTLGAEGFTVLTHHQLPANDGGICLGQALVAAARLEP